MTGQEAEDIAAGPSVGQGSPACDPWAFQLLGGWSRQDGLGLGSFLSFVQPGQCGPEGI